jgi:hypothetical protein
LFEAVQKRLRERAKPRKSKKHHDFPFTGLFRCGECGGMITAQWAKGYGGLYRYYRYTKKNGKWEKEENLSSGSIVERIKGNEQERKNKFDNLVTLYLYGDIPTEQYLKKKNDLLQQKRLLLTK